MADPPQGFIESTFAWDSGHRDVLLAVFVNAADEHGLAIVGVRQGDWIGVTSAAGLASFAEDRGNPVAASLAGIIAAGADAVAQVSGNPELVPVINAVDRFMQEQFRATHGAQKVRDAYGVDPGSGHKARQEGGIIVALPGSGGPYNSGNSDHQERWIQGSGDRTDQNRPAHVTQGFFPIQGQAQHNRRRVAVAGEAYVTAWDYKFPDNAGYYKVFVRLTRG